MEDLPRHIAVVRVAPGSDVHLPWRARVARATDNVGAETVDGTISSFRIRHISVPEIQAWALRVKAKSRNTRETRKRQRRDGQSCDSIPLENQCSWSRTSGSRTVAVGWRDVFQLVLLCTRPAVRYRKCLHNTFVYLPARRRRVGHRAMKTSGDNSKEIRAAPRYITFGVPAVWRPPCSYPSCSSSLDPFVCPSLCRSTSLVSLALENLPSWSHLRLHYSDPTLWISAAVDISEITTREGSQSDALRLFIYSLDLILSSHFWR